MSSESNQQRVDPTLKSLGFFQVVVRKVATRLSVLYVYATVPVSRKIEGKAFEILLVAERKRVDPTLKSLGFFQVVVRKVATRLSVLYDYATVPVYRKIEGKAFEILLVAERKVGNAIVMLQSLVSETKEMEKTLYIKYELVVELVWQKMDELHKFMELLILVLPPSSYYYDDMDKLATYLIEGFLFYMAYNILRFLLYLIPLQKIKNFIYQKVKVQ